MKRILLFLAVAASVAMATQVRGLRLPWNTAKKIASIISGDSVWVDTFFFKHGRESDSAYDLYFSTLTGDTMLATILKGRSAKLTLGDTLLVRTPDAGFLGAVETESALVSKNYVDASDTNAFRHVLVDSVSWGRDTASNLGCASATGDNAFFSNFYRGRSADGDSLLTTKNYVDTYDDSSWVKITVSGKIEMGNTLLDSIAYPAADTSTLKFWIGTHSFTITSD